VLKVLQVRDTGVLVLQNQAGRTVEKHLEHCVPCMLPNLIGDTYAGLVRPHADLPCQVCHDHKHWESMLLCDHCDLGWHTYCLDPPLEDIPDGRWLCPDCVAAGMTLELLADKLGRFVADTESRHALELPSRTRVAKARALADEWHGKGVVHVSRGKSRFGRVVFQGILERKWFAVNWQDGTSSAHNGSMLRNLHIVDEGELPVGVPPVPPPVTIMVTLSSQSLAKLPPLEGPEAVVEYLGMLVSGPDVELGFAVDIMCAVSQAHTPCANTVLRPLMVDALLHVLHLPALHSMLAPVDFSGESHHIFSRIGVKLVFTNHPHAAANSHTHLDPFASSMHEFYATRAGVDAYFLNVPAPLLDIMLPLAVAYASVAVVAVVPATWLFPAPAHRAVWLADEVWATGRGMFLRVVRPDGTLDSHGWLIIFADNTARVRLLQGRVDSAVKDCTWDSRLPHQLARSGSLVPTWQHPREHYNARSRRNQPWALQE
jgi:hypothetical protein